MMKKLTKKDYIRIAKDEGLNSRDTSKYCSFMLKRFPNEGFEPYAREWASRFKNNPAAFMDNISLSIFRGLIG